MLVFLKFRKVRSRTSLRTYGKRGRTLLLPAPATLPLVSHHGHGLSNYLHPLFFSCFFFFFLEVVLNWANLVQTKSAQHMVCCLVRLCTLVDNFSLIFLKTVLLKSDRSSTRSYHWVNGRIGESLIEPSRVEACFSRAKPVRSRVDYVSADSIA